MSDTLLAMVQAACGELLLDAPSTVVGNVDSTATAMLALAKRVGRSLVTAAEWSFLTVEGASITLASGAGSYNLPSDFDRLVQGTTWDRTNKWLTMGPDDPQTARWRRESVDAGLGPRRAVRQVGNALTIWPVPTTTGDVVAFDYVSSNWALSNAGAPQATLLADSDTVPFHTDLFVLGLKGRWLQANGFDASTAAGEFAEELRRAVARDQGGGRTLTMGGDRDRDREPGNADWVVAGGPIAVLGTTGGDNIGID